MAVDDPWAIDGLSLSALEWRRATSGLLVHAGNDVSAAAGVLSGCAVSVVTLTVTVAAGQLVVTPQAGSNGSYLVGMTSTTLSVTARDATYARIDRVVARIYDNAVDGSGQSKAAVEIITGTPSATPAAPTLPAGALELAQLQVPNSAGGSIVVVDKRYRTASAGGSPWFPDTATRDAVLPTPSTGQLCSTGTGVSLVVWGWTGAAWVQVAPVTVPGLVLSSPLPNPDTLTTTQKLVGTTGTAVGYPVDAVTAMIEVNTASGHDYYFQRVQDGSSPFRSWTRRGIYSGGSWTWSTWRCLDPSVSRGRITKTSTLPFSATTWTLINAYGASSPDASGVSVDLTNGRLTVQTSGRYDIIASHNWLNFGTAYDRTGAIVLGTSAPATDGSNVLALYTVKSDSWLTQQLLANDIQLSAGGVITSWIRAGTSGNFNNSSTVYSLPTSLSIRSAAQ